MASPRRVGCLESVLMLHGCRCRGLARPSRREVFALNAWTGAGLLNCNPKSLKNPLHSLRFLALAGPFVF